MNTQRLVVQRLGWFLVLAVLWFTLAGGVVAPSLLFAAEEVAAEGAEDAAAEHSQSFFMWVVEMSGFIGAVIFVLSIYFVATVSRMFWELRPSITTPPDIVAQVEELINQRDFKNVYNVVKDDNSFFSRCLSTGIAELPNGLAEARDVMDRVGESITVEMEKKISMLAVLGTLGPMIGLLGTLKGMIASFSVIAMSDTQLKASQVAGGISEALLLTFEGVALSVPAIYFFSLFRNRVSYLSSSTMLEADQFLRHFAHAARAKGPAGAAPAAPAAAAKK